MICQPKRKLRPGILATCLVCVAAPIFPLIARGITARQVDDFEDGGLGNWTGGGGGAFLSAQNNISSGGPGGVGDNYLQLAAGGMGGAPRLLGVNQAQWTGDYLGAAVGAIGMDLLNPSANPLSIRVALREGTGSSSTPGYVSTHAFSLPADNLWHHAVFWLDDADLTGVNSPAPLSVDLANVAEVRLLDAVNISLMGDPFGSSSPAVAFGVDNITAVPALAPGDFNHDGDQNVSDVQAMMSALVDLGGYEANWGLTGEQFTMLGDFNDDKGVTNQDLQGLINNLASGAGTASPAPVPEPSTWILSISGWMATLPLVQRPRQAATGKTAYVR
jgi:hypothetical protein